MKRNIARVSWCAAILLMVAGCTADMHDEPSGFMSKEVFISVRDTGFNSDCPTQKITRATENAYTTEFTEGDACGLYIVRGGSVVSSNLKLIAKTGADDQLIWSPEGDSRLSGKADDSYFLYYPYQDDVSGKTDASATGGDTEFFAPLISGWTVKEDQSDYLGYAASDLMTAKGTSAKKADGTLALSFSLSHRMALAVMAFPEEIYMYTDKGDGVNPIKAEVTFTGSTEKPYAVNALTYRYIMNPTSSPITFTGNYAEGRREFTVAPSAITAGTYKIYRIEPDPEPH